MDSIARKVAVESEYIIQFSSQEKIIKFISNEFDKHLNRPYSLEKFVEYLGICFNNQYVTISSSICIEHVGVFSYKKVSVDVAEYANSEFNEMWECHIDDNYGSIFILVTAQNESSEVKKSEPFYLEKN